MLISKAKLLSDLGGTVEIEKEMSVQMIVIPALLELCSVDRARPSPPASFQA